MCTPLKDPNFTEPCGFSNLPKKVIDPEEIPSLSISEKPFTEINFSRLDEFLDYLKFPTMTLTKGTVLCHSTSIMDFYNKNKGINLDTIYWWTKYFPGHASYKGGWFTYETSYGGPNFGTNFYYRLEEDLTLLFIPNDFDKRYRRSDPRYFRKANTLRNKVYLLNRIIAKIDLLLSKNYPSLANTISSALVKRINRFICTENTSGPDFLIKEFGQRLIDDISLKKDINEDLIVYKRLINETICEYNTHIKKYYEETGDILNQYVDKYRGSHIIEGVEDWEEKGYTPIEHPEDSYADNLAIKLANLGFNGYISCDECEVYITHEAMKRVLYQPFDFDSVQIRNPILREVIKKGFIPPFEPLNVTHLKNRDIELNESFVSLEDFI